MSAVPEVVVEAFAIADSCARSDIETCCVPVEGSTHKLLKWNTQEVDRQDRQIVAKSLHYLDLRRLIQREPGAPHIVSFPEAAA